jgi:hypothetical protein
MSLTIDDDSISSDRTSHTAHLAPGHEHAWQVSWLPGRLLDRNSAITAMVLADAADEAHRGQALGYILWPLPGFSAFDAHPLDERVTQGTKSSAHLFLAFDRLAGLAAQIMQAWIRRGHNPAAT